MTDLRHQHEKTHIMNLVEHSALSYSKAISVIIPLEFLDTRWAAEVWTYLLSERVVTRKHSCKSWVCYDTTLAIHSLGPLYQHTYA